jgi:hypothetical protein
LCPSAGYSLTCPHRYSSVRNSHITDEIKQTISTRQADVKSAITATDKQLAVLEHRMDEMNPSSDDEATSGSEEDKAEALRQLEQEREAVDTSRRLLDELLAKAQEAAVARAAARRQSSSSTVRFGDHNSDMQVHTLNGGLHGASFGRK